MDFLHPHLIHINLFPSHPHNYSHPHPQNPHVFMNTCSQNKVSYCKQLHISIRGHVCKNLPHIEFDHHAKFGCCFLYCVHACKRSQKFRDAGAPPLGTGMWLTPRNTLLPDVCYQPNVVAVGQTVWVYVGWSQKFWGCWALPTWEWDMADPLKRATPYVFLYQITKFCGSRSYCLSVCRGSQKI